MATKKTKGRQKIEIRRIQNEDDRLITFSKRRSGIYKKASELITLTGAEVAFVVFSPAGKPFSFAHPSIEAVGNRFLGHAPNPINDGTTSIIEAHRQMRIDELNNQYNHSIHQQEMDRKKEFELKQKVNGIETKGWWSANVQELNKHELIRLEAAFKELQFKLQRIIYERANRASSLLYASFSNNATAAPTFPPGFENASG
ncbi:hypothetical protein K2173_006536 [Erythroxylum novogranatense]|uniref:MADS-box domain-containing protein n=1 Tax=Erythroxylum novogranatense TaxID=1862640 RepID=A0AAV8T6L0_9ROSI|nr:hypothetical protein K2173_006536 [Erythroxylum novogranatense]